MIQYVDATQVGDIDAVRAYQLMQASYEVDDDVLLAAVRAAVDVLAGAEGACSRPVQIKCIAVRICHAIGELERLRVARERENANQLEKPVAAADQSGDTSPACVERADR